MTPEQTEAFVDSQLQQNEILRAAIESHINQKVLEERKAFANLIAAKAEKLKRDWGHRWESASESTKSLYAFLMDLHEEIFTDPNRPQESKQESHGK